MKCKIPNNIQNKPKKKNKNVPNSNSNNSNTAMLIIMCGCLKSITGKKFEINYAFKGNCLPTVGMN